MKTLHGIVLAWTLWTATIGADGTLGDWKAYPAPGPNRLPRIFETREDCEERAQIVKDHQRFWAELFLARSTRPADHPIPPLFRPQETKCVVVDADRP